MDGRIRKFASHDTPRVVHHLVQAFQNDAFMKWMVLEHARFPDAMDLFFETCLQTLCAPHGEVLVADDCSGAAMWYPPGTYRIGPITQMKLVPKMIKAGGFRGLIRMVKVIDTLDKIHPKETHYYLHFIGINPEKTGQGLGTAMMVPVLNKCDHEGCGAYLENTHPGNNEFYSKLGFRIKQEIIIQKGAPPLWAMWRDPMIPGTINTENGQRKIH